AGNNVLNGGAGIDTLKGGDGNDTFVLDQFAELALLEELSNQGSDTLNISFAATAINNTVDLSNTNLRNVENVTLLGAGLFSVIGNDQNNILVGNAFANTLNGGAGDDTLNGGAGIDTLIGGTGDDTYLVDNIGDKITELDGEGRDSVQTTVTYTLSNFVEDGILLGAAAINLNGNSEENTLTGNNAANILDGKAGADTLIGGLGNDTYIVDNVGDVVVETSALLTEIDTVQASTSYALGNNLENLTLTGSDSLDGTGNALNNRITGNSGDNRLDGGLGIDTLTGGLGNDTYVVDNLKDVIVETTTLPGEIDTVESSVNWALGANLENLTLTGSENLNGTGNALANVLIGNAGNNILNGGAGIDTLKGGDGNDTFVLDQFAELALLEELSNQGSDTLNISFAATAINNTVDLSSANLRNVENVTLLGAGLFSVIGNDQNNILVGNAFANTLNGGAGDDTLNGGAGIDTLIGGTGDDTYIIDNLKDVVSEFDNEGHDLVQTTVTYTLSNFVEDGQALGAAAINLTGNDEANTLTGNNAANILDGKAGADTLIGGLGNDTYIVDNIGDVVVETSALLTEIDTVQASISYALGNNLENLTLTGSDSLDGTGNALNNRITGNSGSNRLDGGLGIDTLTGGLGNDTYVVDNLKDVIVETSTLITEVDTVESSVNWTLGTNLENLTLTGSDNLNGTGNALINTMIGNSGNNILNGGAGNDTLTGGSGADTFVFNLLSELGLGDKRDAITDFNSAQGDKIDLSKLDANVLLGGINPFTFIGAAEFTGAGQLRFVDEVLSGNINGNLNNDFEIHLVGVTALTANDFV
ncbi:beta strand repeat-containing protein, partial [Pseudomonas quasicaspiana]|uniref:beta strand repeat-containing protein n=1 Tax=Pseudomonas quasicaspiana TaxID=2829821 RepID=UPI0029E7ED5D